MVLIAGLAALLPAGASAAWGDPEAATRGGIARSPSVALDPAGRLAVAYVRSTRGVARVELRHGTLADGLSGAPVLVARRADRPGATSLGFDGVSGSTLTAWDHGLAASTSALLTSREGRPLLPLGPFAGSVAPRVLRAPDGTLRLVLHGASGLSVLRVGVEPVQRLDLPEAGRDARVAVTPAGEVVAAWTASGQVLMAVAAPGGGFGAPVALATTGGPREPRLVAGADGRVLVAWLTAIDGRFGIEAASRAPDGTAGATVRLVDPAADARAPVLAAASDGELLLAFLDTSGPTRPGHVDLDRGVLRVQRMTPEGAPLGPAVRVSGALERPSGAGFAVEPGGTQVVWSTVASVRARRLAPGGRRGRVRVLSERGVDGGAVPSAAGGSAGGYAAAWVSRGRVMVARGR